MLFFESQKYDGMNSSFLVFSYFHLISGYSLPSLTQSTLLFPITLVSNFLAVMPQEFLTPFLMHFCFNSGVSIPENLIFLPFK